MYRRTLGNKHHHLAIALKNLARALAAQGRNDEAETARFESRHIYRQRFGPEHKSVAGALRSIGDLSSTCGKLEQALDAYRESLSICRRILDSGDARIATLLKDRVDVLARLEQYAEAEAAYRESLYLRRVELGGEHPDTLDSLSHLGKFLLERDRHAEALPLLERASVEQHLQRPEGDLGVALAAGDLGDCPRALGRYGDTEPLLLTRVNVLREAHTEGDERTAAAIQALVELFEVSGMLDKAEAWRASLQPAD